MGVYTHLRRGCLHMYVVGVKHGPFRMHQSRGQSKRFRQSDIRWAWVELVPVAVHQDLCCHGAGSLAFETLRALCAPPAKYGPSRRTSRRLCASAAGTARSWYYKAPTCSLCAGEHVALLQPDSRACPQLQRVIGYTCYGKDCSIAELTALSEPSAA